MRYVMIAVSLALPLLVACSSPSRAGNNSQMVNATTQATMSEARLRLATTTSTADSGLLDAILPDFEQRTGATVEVIAVGTGQALKIGESGDADVVLAHARAREDAFVAQGFGVDRRDVMYNDFVIVGPRGDPAGIRAAASAAEAFQKIAARESLFASRGDDSGTYSKERAIWQDAGLDPSAENAWYRSLGQGMSETLIAADEMGAYTLSDRGTWLAQRERLTNLDLLFGGATIAENPDSSLRNPYGVIMVNPARHPGIQADLARQFINWITSPEIQKRIGEFGVDRYGQPLFYPQANDE